MKPRAPIAHCPSCKAECAGEWGEDGVERAEVMRCDICGKSVCEQCSASWNDYLMCDAHYTKQLEMDAQEGADLAREAA